MVGHQYHWTEIFRYLSFRTEKIGENIKFVFFRDKKTWPMFFLFVFQPKTPERNQHIEEQCQFLMVKCAHVLVEIREEAKSYLYTLLSKKGFVQSTKSEWTEDSNRFFRLQLLEFVLQSNSSQHSDEHHSSISLFVKWRKSIESHESSSTGSYWIYDSIFWYTWETIGSLFVEKTHLWALIWKNLAISGALSSFRGF